MSVSLPLTAVPPQQPAQLAPRDAATYAEWFACLAEPMRVRLLHAVAVAGREVTVGELTEQLGISQSTCSHHLRKLADVGFVQLRKERTATLVSVNPACCTGLPHAADAVMGMLGPRPCCPQDLPVDVTVRALEAGDWADVRRIYAEGIATGNATFETEVPDRRSLDHAWLPEHRWVAEVDGQVAGFVMVVGSEVEQVYVAASHRGTGVADVLLDAAERRVAEAGHPTAWLAVVAENGRARRFYERRGWSDDGPFDYAAAGEDGPIPVAAHRYVKAVLGPEILRI